MCKITIIENCNILDTFSIKYNIRESLDKILKNNSNYRVAMVKYSSNEIIFQKNK